MTILYTCNIKLYQSRSSQYLYVDTDETPKTWPEIRKALDKAIQENQRFDKSRPLRIEIVDSRIAQDSLNNELEEEQVI